MKDRRVRQSLKAVNRKAQAHPSSLLQPKLGWDSNDQVIRITRENGMGKRIFTHLCFFIFFLRLRWVLSSSTVRPWSPIAAVFSAGLRPSRRNVASQLTALLTAFIANVRESSRAVSASASGVVSGGSSNVAWAPADAEAVVVELEPCGGAGLSASVVEESKSADAGWESTRGRYCEKNWCRRRSGALSGGWDASAVGAADGVGRVGEDDPALDGDVVVVPEASSGEGDDDCCC